MITDYLELSYSVTYQSLHFYLSLTVKVLIGSRLPKLSIFFIVATMITEVLFQLFLIRTDVQRGEHSTQRTVMDTLLSFQIQ